MMTIAPRIEFHNQKAQDTSATIPRIAIQSGFCSVHPDVSIRSGIIFYTFHPCPRCEESHSLLIQKQKEEVKAFRQRGSVRVGDDESSESDIKELLSSMLLKALTEKAGKVGHSNKVDSLRELLKKGEIVWIDQALISDVEKLQKNHGGLDIGRMLSMFGKPCIFVEVDSDGDIRAIPYEGGDTNAYSWNPLLVEQRRFNVCVHQHQLRLMNPDISEWVCSGASLTGGCRSGDSHHTRVLRYECCDSCEFKLCQPCLQIHQERYSSGEVIWLKDVSKEEATRIQEKHGGINDDMVVLLGKPGVVASFLSDGDTRVFPAVGGSTTAYRWNPEAIETHKFTVHVHRHPLTLLHSSFTRGDHWCDGAKLPGGCKAPGGVLNDLDRFRCGWCNFDLCEKCYNAYSYDPFEIVSIKEESAEETSRVQVSHGGVNDVMLENLGKTGFVAEVDKDGDLMVVPLEGSGATPFCWNPCMVKPLRFDVRNHGHSLRMFIAGITAWSCDGVNFPGGCRGGCSTSEGSEGKVRLRCILCDFDYCQDCFTKWRV